MKTKVSYSIRLFLVFLSLFPLTRLRAQQNNSMYLMHEVPQSNLLNPAVQIRCKYFVGIPLLSSLHFNYSNTAFSYNDLAGSGTWNIEGVEARTHSSDLYSVEAQVALLSLGYRYRSNYITFNILERAHAYMSIPGDLVSLSVYGNGAFIGETVKMDGTRPGGIHAREYSLGLSRHISPSLTAGIRLKLMFGKANVTTGKSDLRLRTAEDNFHLDLSGDYTLNTSFPYHLVHDAEGNPEGIEMEEIEALSYMMNRKNPGIAIDLGFIYRYDENITLSASLLDLGFLRWRSDVNNLSGEGTYRYTGIELNAGPGTEDFLQEALDSLASGFNFTGRERAYSYMLPTQLFLAGSYRYSEHLSLGLVNRNVIYRSKWHASLTASASVNLGGRFLGTLSWSWLNNTVKNLGIGLAYHGNGFQFHAVTDNLLTAFYPFDSRILNLRIGMNLLLGCPKNKKQKQEQDRYTARPGNDCPLAENPKKIRKKRIRAARRLNR